MPSIKINIVANLVGRIWAVAIGILLIPQYIKYLGIESYGLIGFYGTLIGSMALLDLGLSTTIKRELAKYQHQVSDSRAARDLLFSLECIYWGIGVCISLLVVLFAGLIATHWVKVETLPVHTVTQSVMLMGAVIAFQWPISLYDGGLTGLDKQVLNNVITVIMSTLRAAGVIIILKYFSATLEAFFIWQAVLSFLYVMVMRMGLWRHMPKNILKPTFSKAQLKNVWRFAAGMTSISIITFFLAQIDKIVLSKILPLSVFGYYTLAFTIASSMSMVSGPLSITFFPRFTKLVSIQDEITLKKIYHNACRLMATIIAPIGFLLIFFTKEILFIWTHNADTTSHTYLMARILVAGSILNALIVMPYNLIIAYGWTRFTIYQNTIAAIILVPMLLWWTSVYGPVGATFVWLTVNAGYVLISQPVMHKTLLKNELFTWYWKDTAIPLLISFLLLGSIKLLLCYFFPAFTPGLIAIAIIFVFVFSTSMLTLKNFRDTLRTILRL
ncbi:MAG: oligosaccharide flippase family protein [Bacteroidetes bacterium]|nr:oligosaccharide flippase family protein [Bacteroidota bacterium]